MLTRKVIYLITDQYKPGSTKSLECERSKDLMVQCDFGLKKGSRSNWTNGRNTWEMINKSELVKFLLEDWSNPNVLCPLIYSCHYFVFQLWLTINQIETNGWCCWMCIWRMIQVLLSTKRAKALGTSAAILQYTHCIFLCKYQFLCISWMVLVTDRDASMYEKLEVRLKKTFVQPFIPFICLQ